MNNKKLMGKDKKLAYLSRVAIITCIYWLTLTNIPFLGDIRHLYIYVLLFLITYIAIYQLKNNIKINFISFPLNTFVICILLSSIFNSTFFNKELLISIFTLYLIYIYSRNKSNEDDFEILKQIYILFNLITSISLIGILIVKYTDVLNSSNAIIRLSFGNFIDQDGRFFGLLNSCNTLAPIAAMNIIITIFSLKNRSPLKYYPILIFILLFNTYILWGAQSYTTMLGLVIAIMVLLLFRLNKHRVFALSATIILGLLALTIVLMNLEQLCVITGRDWTTGSSRTIIWKSAFKIIQQHPIIGTGSPENYLKIAQTQKLYIHPNGTHNIFIETATRYGIPASLLLFLSILYLIVKTIGLYLQNKKIDNIPFYFSIFMFFTTTCFLETYILYSHTPIMILYFLAYFTIQQSIKENIN